MALSTFLPTPSSSSQKKQRTHPPKRKRKQPPKPPSSWEQIKSVLSCKHIESSSQVHDPSKNLAYSKLGSSCNSICSFRDVVHGNTRVIHREENSPESSSLGQETGLLRRNLATAALGLSSNRSSGMHLRKLSGCYECHMIVDPSRYPSARSSICACSECGEVFVKAESLEIHQAVRHAVSELDAEDSGRNIVEIIFKSSWLKKDTPIMHIDRILKVHNTPRTVARFEDYRASVKARASSHTHTHNRCAADGNELLRFHCATIACSLGARGSSSLCASGPDCGVCTIIRHGFVVAKGGGVRTTASSGRAHDSLMGVGKRAMLVCRVIAGRVKRLGGGVGGEAEMGWGCEEEESASAGAAAAAVFDSVVGHAGMYSNLEELSVFNPRAILPCFVVIYRASG